METTKGVFLLGTVLCVLFPVICYSHSCESGKPQVELGDALPECDLDESYCGKFGLDFVCTETYRFRHPCKDRGQNVICSSPDKNLAPATPATTLKVLAYNVWERGYTYYQNGQHERTCRIPQQIFDLYGDLDVIVFNEAFMGGCFPYDGVSFRDMLTQYGFEHFTKTLGEEDREDTQNGGVFIASRWPIVKESERIYKNAAQPSPDNVSDKGLVYAKIEKETNSGKRIYHILGTHMLAGLHGDEGVKIRALQAKEMRMFVEEQNITAEEPVIYAGDLNTDLHGTDRRWEQMLEIFQANMPGIVGDLNVTIDYENNDVRVSPEDGGKWLDYVIYSNQHLMPNNASQESIKFVDENPFEVCIQPLPTQEPCQLAMNITDLAEHYAVLGRFDFSSAVLDPVEYPTPEPIPEECTNDVPKVWLGYATNECDLTPKYCEMFGLEEVCTASYKTWDLCHVRAGKNVLCAVPKITLPRPTPATTFKVLTYNVYELRYLYYQSGQRERTCRILTQIFTRHGDVDAIVFQEAIMGGCFPDDGASFRDIMTYYGFKYFTGTLGEDLMRLLPPPYTYENGGVFIASRWPILSWDETVYESKVAISYDAMAAKGAIYAEIEKSVGGKTRKYHVLGTHLQADHDDLGDEVRFNQTVEMHALMLKQNVPKDEAVIYGGDFNTDFNSKPVKFQAMLEAMEAKLPQKVGNINCTSDKCFNDINKNDFDPDCNEERDWLPGIWLDYVLYSYSHQVPVKSSLEAIKYVDEPKFTVCMDHIIEPFGGHLYPYSDRCIMPNNISDLSDHYAVLGTFEYSVVEDVPSSPAMRHSSLFSVVAVFLPIIFS
ncbi:uncharacterized protein LOC144438869 [Glandiceps talaboti]